MAIQTPSPLPVQSTPVLNPDGKMNEAWYRSLKATVDSARGSANAGNTVEPWAFATLIQYPEDGDLTVILSMPYAVTIASVTTKCTTGTATLTVKIGSTALGGTANNVSTSEQTQAHTTDNAMAIGDDLVFTFSSVASAENVSVTVAGTVG